MKHLRSFKIFEGVDEASFRKNLKTYCTEALINLIEFRNYKVYVFKSKDGELDLCIHAFPEVSTWKEIKDYIIPFFEILKEDYEVIDLLKKNNYQDFTGIHFSLHDVLNDTFDDEEEISDIEITVRVEAS